LADGSLAGGPAEGNRFGHRARKHTALLGHQGYGAAHREIVSQLRLSNCESKPL
jgi:hypothetical protein